MELLRVVRQSRWAARGGMPGTHHKLFGVSGLADTHHGQAGVDSGTYNGLPCVGCPAATWPRCLGWLAWNGWRFGLARLSGLSGEGGRTPHTLMVWGVACASWVVVGGWPA